MIIVAMHVNRASRAGSFSAKRSDASGPGLKHGLMNEYPLESVHAERPFDVHKTSKEQTRQQRQRDKLERRNQRKQEKSAEGTLDEMAELRAHAAAQAALFNLGAGDADTAEGTVPGDQASE